jgi:quinol monooxygenase YgiN
MIRHIVFFSAKDPADLGRIEAGLKPLERIEAASRLEVRRNLACDQLGNEIEIVVYGEFADRAALDAYKADPLYAEAIRIVRPLRELRFAADILAEDAPGEGRGSG